MYYFTDPADFTIGQRVQVHPATSLWMSGARYGTVVKVTRTRVHVRMDIGRTLAFDASNLAFVD